MLYTQYNASKCGKTKRWMTCIVHAASTCVGRLTLKDKKIASIPSGEQQQNTTTMDTAR